MRKKSLLCLFLCAVCLFAHAQPLPAKIETCVACHGQTGVATNPAWPNIAGQHAVYLLKQLKEIRAGKTRNVPVMSGIVATLSDEELAALASYYAAQPPPSGLTPQKALKPGEALYRGGDRQKRLSACIACHGPGGEGNGQAGFPLLSGQQALYTIQQLQDFRSGKRKNDLNGIMQTIGHHLDDEDIQTLAYYLQGLYSR